MLNPAAIVLSFPRGGHLVTRTRQIMLLIPELRFAFFQKRFHAFGLVFSGE